MRFLSFLFAIVAPLSVSATAVAEHHTQAAAPVSADQVESRSIDGFRPIFSDDSLDGWEKRGGEEAEFSLDDGVLTGKAQNMRHNSFLCSEKAYGDFIIAFQFRFVNLDGNSGLMFRAQQRENDGRVFGYQCEHDNTLRSWTAGLFDESRRGWLFPIQKSDAAKDQLHRDQFTGQGIRLFDRDGWNTIIIKCEGEHIQTWLNGELRVDTTDDVNDSGFFGFQVHNGKNCEVQWRNVLIKEL